MRLQKYGIGGLEEVVRIGEELRRMASREQVALFKYLGVIRSAARMRYGVMSGSSCKLGFSCTGVLRGMQSIAIGQMHL